MTIRSYKRTAISISVIIVLVMAFVLGFSGSSFAGSVPSATGQIDSEGGAYLRSKASTSSAAITVLGNDEPVVISKVIFKGTKSTASNKKWYYVTAGGNKGYVRGDLIDNIKYTAVSAKVTSKVNYRNGAGILMKKAGTLEKGTAVKVYLAAKPVTAAQGSSSLWYRIKVGSKYYYACSSAIKITGSSSKKETTTSKSTTKSTSSKTQTASASAASAKAATTSKASASKTTAKTVSSFAKMTSAQFDDYLTKQGFPTAYKKKLKALHKAHPNWVFIADTTGINWSDALARETRNGVSLIHSSYPTSYRSTDSNSYTGTNLTIYKTPAGSTKTGTLKTGDTVTVMKETWKGTTRWSKIRTSGGKTGYVCGAPQSQSHSKVIEGKTTQADVNIRKGAGTNNSVAKTLSKKGTKVSVVLQATDKDGDKWYKIVNGSGYAYIHSDFVKLSAEITSRTETEIVTPSASYPAVKTKSALDFRAVPDESYPVLGTFAKKSVLTVVSYCKVSDEKWYKVYYDGSLVYVKSDALKVSDDLKKSSAPSEVTGVVTADVLNIRKSAGTSAEKVGELDLGDAVTIQSVKKSGKDIWYKIVSGKKKGYVSSAYIEIDLAAAPKKAAPKIEVEVQETKTAAKPGSLTNTATFAGSGKWIPKDGATWFNASSDVVAYYMDPRNFLNEDRIYMFEDLTYKKEYQTKDVVAKVLSGTRLPGNGFTAQLFVKAGKKYNVSPVHLAARARQETGGGSIAITGYKIKGVKVYNPFNIGASSCANPVVRGLNYAYSMGWRSQKKAVYGGASYLASGYISKGQNSCYYQRFNVSNGSALLGTHQYMTNITAPYSEALSTKNSYSAFGITEEALTFIIPVYKSMPSSTKLP